MIRAVTLDKNTNNVFGHFGEAKNFFLYDTEKEVGKIVDNGGFTHHELIKYIKSLNAEVLICGGMGNHAYEALTASNIKVFPGAKGDVMEVVNKYLNNKLVVDLSKLHQCSHNH